MAESDADKPYDLEERTYQFAKRVAVFGKKLPQNLKKIFASILLKTRSPGA